MFICDMCNETIGEGEAYGLQTVLIEKDWIDCRDGIQSKDSFTQNVME